MVSGDCKNICFIFSPLSPLTFHLLAHSFNDARPRSVLHISSKRYKMCVASYIVCVKLILDFPFYISKHEVHSLMYCCPFVSRVCQDYCKHDILPYNTDTIDTCILCFIDCHSMGRDHLGK